MYASRTRARSVQTHIALATFKKGTQWPSTTLKCVATSMSWPPLDTPSVMRSLCRIFLLASTTTLIMWCIQWWLVLSPSLWRISTPSCLVVSFIVVITLIANHAPTPPSMQPCMALVVQGRPTVMGTTEAVVVVMPRATLPPPDLPHALPTPLNVCGARSVFIQAIPLTFVGTYLMRTTSPSRRLQLLPQSLMVLTPIGTLILGLLIISLENSTN
jgi:hypothetical protein